MKLMIVDDNTKIREMLKEIIGEDNNDFCECSDGAEAVELYNQFKPDIVLMDIKMKRMDGIKATRLITEQNPGATIIMVTNCDDESFRSAAKKAGAKDYIVKENMSEIKNIIPININHKKERSQS